MNKSQQSIEVSFSKGAILTLKKKPAFEKALVVTTINGKKRFLKSGLSQDVLDKCFIVDTVELNPSVDSLNKLYHEVKKISFDVIIGFGGGSALDSARVLKAMIESDCELPELIDQKDFSDSVKLVQIPTTAGTGSDMVQGATIWDKKSNKKLSLSHPSLYADLAIIDWLLMKDVPLKQSVFSGLDAFSHALESYWSKPATTETREHSVKSIAYIIKGLKLLHKNNQDLNAREELAKGAFEACFAFGQTRTASAHSISYPLTLHLGIPHGLSSSFSLPALFENHYKNNPDIFESIYKQLQISFGQEDVVEAFYVFYKDLKIDEYLKEYKTKDIKVIERLVQQSYTKGRMDNDIDPPSHDEVATILKKNLFLED